MKIGVIIPQKKLFGGGPRLALELAQELKQSGHEPLVYTPRYTPDESQFLDLTKGITISSLSANEDVPPKPLLGRELPGLSTLSSYRHEHRVARKLARIMDPTLDALNPHSSRLAYLTAHYYKKLHRRKIPVVWQMNDIQLFHYKLCMPSPGNPEGSCSKSAALFYRAIDAIDQTFFLPSVDRISVLSDETKRLAQEMLGRKASVIRSGVHTSHFPYKKRQPPDGKRLKLLAHAQFFRHRRFEDAIRAVKILTDKGWEIELAISGDSETYRAYRDYRDELARLSKELGIEKKITFPGRVSDGRLIELFHNADIFVYPHILQSWGLVVFEAMATGMPVVASQETGASEVLEEGKTALLIEARRPELLAVAIERLASDKELYRSLSENGYAFVAQQLSWKRFADAIVELIGEARDNRIHP